MKAKTQIKIQKHTANIARKLAVISANTSCISWMNQDSLPNKIKLLRKF